MRKAIKFFHSLASCGLLGALFGYAILLLAAPQETATEYAYLRRSISLLCNYLLIPSLALALITGLLSMAVHRPFQELRWAWVKLLMGLLMFEATLAVVQSKANYASQLADKVAKGDPPSSSLVQALQYEWHSLVVISALSIANILLGVWRPSLRRQARAPQPK